MPATTDVAIVGGGPAGAALAIRLAQRGISTTLIERRAAPTWRASGVFSSPLARDHLARLGFSTADIGGLNRPIAALDLETVRGARCRIEYAYGHACGFDRIALETALLDRARAAGATVMSGTVVRGVALSTDGVTRSLVHVSPAAAMNRSEPSQRQVLSAHVVVGADGPTSLVSRAVGVYRTYGRFSQAGITFHRADASAAPAGDAMDGRFVFGSGWYVGIAPVPRNSVNVGMVVPALQGQRPHELSEQIIAALPGPRQPWMTSPTADRVTTQGRLEHHAARAGGPSWLLVGDAIGFIDPLTGEGLLRAFVSAERAAEAIGHRLRGDRTALADYDRHIRRRLYGKNVVSWMLQLFLARPQVLDYALMRLARRTDLREQLTLVLTDQAPASTALSPRFLARLLAP